MASKKKLAVFVLAAGMAMLLGLLLATPGGRAVGKSLKWSTIRQLRAYTFNRRLAFTRYDNEVVALFRKKQAADPGTVVSACRRFIFAHAESRLELRYNTNLGNMYEIAQRALHDDSVKMPMKCDARAHLMRNILFNIGVDTRLVHGLFLNEQGEVNGHTFLEAHDDASKHWVVQDPYANLSFVRRDTGRPAGLMELCLYPIGDFAPSPDCDPEDFTRWGTFFARIYSLVVYDHRLEGDINIVVINKEKLGVRSIQEFSTDPRFAEMRAYLTANWNDYRIIDP